MPGEPRISLRASDERGHTRDSHKTQFLRPSVLGGVARLPRDHEQHATSRVAAGNIRRTVRGYDRSMNSFDDGKACTSIYVAAADCFVLGRQTTSQDAAYDLYRAESTEGSVGE